MKESGETLEQEQELARRFIESRDEVAFRLLYRMHTSALYLLALRLSGGNQPDAEDVVQETWLRASRRLKTFRWESTLRTWLCGMLVNCFRELRRKPNPEPLTGAEWSYDPHPANSRDLETGIRKLPDGCREVFVLHDIEGLTHQEISKKLDISDGTSKSQLFAARRMLRAHLLGERRVSTP